MEELPPPPWEWKKLFVCLLLLMLAALQNVHALVVVHDMANSPQLPDIVLDNIPEQKWAYKVHEYSLASVVVLGGVVILLHKYRRVLIRRVSLILASVFFCRAMCQGLTQLPGLNSQSRPCLDVDPNATVADMLKRFLMNVVTLSGYLTGASQTYCGDMMFSGHTTVFLTSYQFVNYYMPRCLWPLKVVVAVLTHLSMGCLILARSHYTVDVLISYWITLGLFTLYHAYCECELPHELRDGSGFHYFLVFWLVGWLESGVPGGRLPRQLAWPLPWPKPVTKCLEGWSDGPIERQNRVNKALNVVADKLMVDP